MAWDSGEGRYLVESGGQVKVNLVVYSGRRELQEVSGCPLKEEELRS